jgi:hypothetical protein
MGFGALAMAADSPNTLSLFSHVARAHAADPSGRCKMKSLIAYYSTGEWPLVGAGLATAAGSAAFAFFMAAGSDGRPVFAGEEHLQIFAQPSLGGVGLPAAASLKDRFPQIDFTPTGTIDRTAPAAAIKTLPSKAKFPSAERVTGLPERLITGYTLHGVFDGQALVLGPQGVETVKVGDELHGIGTVTKITLRDGAWALITTQGRIESIQ